MTFSSIVFYTGQIYYPKNNEGLDLYVKQEKLNQIAVCFNGDVNVAHKLKKLCRMVTNAIALMSERKREHESERFFLYLISCPRRDIKDYLQPLLEYFHMIGHLKFKKNIYNENKQGVVRYKVEFKNKDGGLIVTKRYSSLSQLSDDTGGEMTSLHYQLFKTAA